MYHDFPDTDGFPVHIFSLGLQLHPLSSLLLDLTIIFRMKALIVYFIKCQKVWRMFFPALSNRQAKAQRLIHLLTTLF